jgi:hypothetical protein
MRGDDNVEVKRIRCLSGPALLLREGLAAAAAAAAVQ